MQKSREEVIGKTDFDIFPYEHALHFRENDAKVLENNLNSSFEELMRKEGKEDAYFHSSKQIVYDENGAQRALFCIVKNITLTKQYEFIYEDSQEILKQIAMCIDFQKLLENIVFLVEKRMQDSQCSILLLDEDDSKKHLLHAVTRNLHSCWSEPILDSTDEIVGTFAIYNKKTKTPTDFELKLIHTYANLISLAIEKRNKERLFKEKEQQMLKETQEANMQLSKLFDNAFVGLMHITAQRTLLKANQRLADILGYETPQEMIGISMRALHVSEENFIEFGKRYFYGLQNGENITIEYQARKKDGSAIWCEFAGKVLEESGESSFNKGVIWAVNDISQRKLLEEEIRERTQELEIKNERLQKLASTDYLTGLYNRSKIDDFLQQQLKYSKRYQNSFGVILLDIDFFKEVNDTFGHQSGDVILQEFAEILTKNSRESDIVGRWGGEEFFIIVEEMNRELLLIFAEKLRSSIESYDFPIVKYKTASFGVTLYRFNDERETIIKRVDEALYEAKNSGRNRVCFGE